MALRKRTPSKTPQTAKKQIELELGRMYQWEDRHWSEGALRFNNAETMREVVHPTTMAITQTRSSLAIEAVAGEMSRK